VDLINYDRRLFVDIFNPLRYFSPHHYTDFWQTMFNTFLMGFWGRLFASLSLILAFWCGVVKEKLPWPSSSSA